MEKNIKVQLPEFEVKVLDEKELLMVTGGLIATSGTKSQCNKDGTNDGD